MLSIKKTLVASSVIALTTWLSACSSPEQTKVTTTQQLKKPNLVIFYVDDLGYGDVGVNGATRVQTPNVDALAKNGINFTDAHTSSATCTPSRYSLLTGSHAFRKNVRILPGDAAMTIGVDQPTLPKLLKKAGYKSAVIGKWHLGLGDGKKEINWNEAVKPGPLEIGFDYSFLLPATGDRVPSVYLENHHVVNLDPNDPLTVSYKKKIGNRPTGIEHPELMRQHADKQHAGTIINGISRIGWMAGGKSAEWVDEEFHSVLTDKAAAFMEQNKDNPFFLFMSFHDIHVPRLPAPKFQGKSKMGPRGDAIAQMDWITGQVMNKLKELGKWDDTIIIFSSDNGAVIADGYDDQAYELLGDHKPNGVYRGGKYSAFEAATRVPFIIHYPEMVKPGVSNSLMSQIDVYASMAHLLGLKLSKDEAIDSQNHLQAFFNADVEGRQILMEESATFSLRDGQWKYIKPGKRKIKPGKKRIERGVDTIEQLYDLSTDPSEQINVAEQYPERVKAMATEIKKIQAQQERL